MQTTPANLVDTSDVLSAIAIIVTVGTLVFTFWLHRREEAVGIRPVLTFIYSDKLGWVLRNVGAGPALNVLVAQKKVGGDWFNPVRVPPLSAGAERVLEWLGHVNTTGLGALYIDFKERPYSSRCHSDLSTVHVGHVFGPWPESAIGRHWNQPTYREQASVSETKAAF